MPTPFISPIQRLAAEGKVRLVSAEAEARLLEHMKKHYVAAAMSAQRRNRTDSEGIKNVPLRK